LESISQARVKRCCVLETQTFFKGRVHYEVHRKLVVGCPLECLPGPRIRVEVLETFLLEMDLPGTQPRPGGVAACNGNGLRIPVKPKNFSGWVILIGSAATCGRSCPAVWLHPPDSVRPLVKGEALLERRRRKQSVYPQRCFNRHCTATAHRIHEQPIFEPDKLGECSSNALVKRCIDGLAPVAAEIERNACRVRRKFDPVSLAVENKDQVRIPGVNLRP